MRARTRALVTAVLLLVGAIVAIPAGALVLLTLTDADRYRQALARLVYERSGLHFIAEPPLAWSLQPWPVLEMRDVRAGWDPEVETPLLTARRVELHMAPFGLLPPSPDARIDTIVVRDARLNLRTSSEDRATWRPPRSVPVPRGPVDIPVPLAAELPKVDLLNGSVRYSDTSKGLHAAMDGVELHLQAEHPRSEPGAEADGWRGWLAGLQWDLALDAARAELRGVELAALQLRSWRDPRGMHAELNAGTAPDAHLVARLRTGSKEPSSELTLEVDARTLPPADMAQAFGLPAWMEGAVDAQAMLRAEGTDLRALARSTEGYVRLHAREGTIDARALRALMLRIARLAGHGERVVNWPDRIPYKQLRGRLVLEGGLGDQRLTAAIDNLRLEARGGIAPFTGRYDYHVQARLDDAAPATFDIHPDLAGVGWPVRCKGPLARSPTALCHAPRAALQARLAEVMRDAANARIRRDADARVRQELEPSAMQTMRELLRREALGGDS